MEKFNIKKVYTDKQAIMEMEYQYDKLITVESSTARCNRFFNMLALYERFPILKSIWEYIEDAYQYIKKFVRKTVEAVQDIVGNLKKHYFYIMRFYDRHGDFLFDKIGSTEQDPHDRLNQHLGNYVSAWSGEILLTYDTEEIAPSSVENTVRNYLIKKLGQENWIKIDRFKKKLDLKDIKSKLPTCIEKLRAAEIPV